MRFLAVLLCAVLVAGCSGGRSETAAGSTTTPSTPSTPATSAPAEPDAATVSWVDGVCAAEAALTANPAPPQVAEPPTGADRPAVIAFLGAARDRFRGVLRTLDGLGAAPSEEAEELVAAQRSVAAELAAKLTEATRNATVFPVPEFGAPYRLARMELSSFTVGTYLSDLTERDQTLARAYELAPRC